MNPTMTIVDYLFAARNTWFSECGDDCQCSIEERIENFLDGLPVDIYATVLSQDDKPVFGLKMLSDEEWNEEVGPKAQNEALQAQLDHHMNKVTEIMSLQLTKERLSGE